MKYLLLSVILTVAVFSSCTKKEEEFAVAVSFVIGDVSRNGVQLAIGEEILEGDIVTTGSSSSCDVKSGGSIIRIKEKSVMKFSKMNFSDGNENTVFALDQGKLLCKPKKLLKDDSFIVKTPTAVAAVRGTQFTVETDIKKTTRINVYDGKVKVARRAPSLDDKIDEIMENISPLEEKESAVITKEEADKAEQAVSDGLKSAQAKDVIAKNISALAIGTKDIKKFAVADFA
ncbi:MAG TPA: FecR family protein, partial [Spirochaetota bacterium]|nr:FecR family protein [Spirochaetota bacterium]